jgi:putative CocE/NonD family hydrolase
MSWIAAQPWTTGKIGTAPKNEPPDRFVYDPGSPVPSKAGPICCTFSNEPAGAVDQRDVESRHDVLVYTSEPLREPLEVTGPIEVVLWAASDARDTDFTAKLVDVAPDGTAINLADSAVRARYRDSVTAPTLLEPGAVNRYRIDLVATSNVFLPGHRVRVEISSSNFPRFDRNPNTGELPGLATETRPAAQTIYHDAERPSHIVLPVVLREAYSG